MPDAQGHVLFLGNGSWPDLKQLCTFATRLVKLHPLNATVFATEDWYDRAQREVFGESEGSALLGFVRIVALPSERTKRLTDPVFEAAFTDVFDKLVACQNFQCVATGETHGPLPAPRAVISPNFTVSLLENLRQRSQHPVEFLAWYSHTPAALFLFHGPMERGGIKDLYAKIHEEMQRRGAPAEEVIQETVRFMQSLLIRVPGYEPMYSYEIQPQDFIQHGDLGAEWLTIYDMFMACDGVLMCSPEGYDETSIIGARYWMKEKSRNAYAVGPLLSRGPRAIDNEFAIAHKGAETREFLDTVLKSQGEKSSLYISFGGAMWPKYWEKLETFLDTVIELRVPFILSHASEYATVPEDFKAKVDRYGLGIMSSLCPQQMILDHPATGWFVTHCGHGSVMESISAGVPLICWPYVGDEALNAIYLTDTLNVGYELHQIRTGPGLGRIYRTGSRAEGTPAAIHAESKTVIQKAFGEDGAKKRANLKRLQAKLGGVWEEGGASQQAALALLKDLGL